MDEDSIKEIRKGLHDINNKLSAVVACCDLLLIEVKSEDQLKKYLQYSLQSAKVACDLVYNIFEILNKLQEKRDPPSVN